MSEGIIKSYHDLVNEFKEEMEATFKLHEIVAKRNKSLAKLILLDMASNNLFTDKKYDWKQFQAKRGKKEDMEVPLKAIMDILSVSHRTAQDYQRTRKAMFYVSRLGDIKFNALQWSILALQELSDQELKEFYRLGKIE